MQNDICKSRKMIKKKEDEQETETTQEGKKKQKQNVHGRNKGTC
jgi:hypothetical protein